METYALQPQTLVLVALFVVSYLALLLRKTVRGELDLYDLIQLAMLALLTGFFSFFSGTSFRMSQALGVAFPFVLLFGSLFAVVFLFLHRLTVQNHTLQQRTVALIQELGLLRQDVERIQSDSRWPEDL